MAHGEVQDAIVERVKKRVLEGMGLVVLHSGHYAKIFKSLLGTTCSLKWREASDKERIWNILPSHPITQGIGDYFEIPAEEMYGEPFGIPTRMSCFSSPGSPAARSSAAVRRGSAETVVSSTSARVTKRIRPITRPRCKR